ncbi:hypothetical protein NQ315_017180 [Exocentrus adspersus]|uniref:Ionotropic receptor 75a N-terminal domain-containing protein n=1 Tax=Exocentrus adspersus TaxID=1586481 RepID=A0AAV8VHT4_9CUCU|nr:hypothetical protein NQ315_017180 [Exocentrus adspersus]
MKMINDSKLFRYPLKFLFLTEKDNYLIFLKKLNPMSVLPMSEVVIANVDEDIVNLTQPYKIRENESLVIEDYGTWTRKTGITLNYDSNSFAERRRNFHKSEITLSVVVNKIEHTKIPDFDDFPESNSDEPYFFQDFANINYLMQYLNATYSLRVFNSYGYLNNTTGRFDGMAEDIYEERSDLSGSYLILSEDRQRIMEFLKPTETFAAQARFILKKPAMSYIENIYYMTFTYKVWIASLVILGVMAVSLYVLLNWEVKMATKDNALKALYWKKIHPNRFYSLEYGLDKVQDGNFAFQVILGPAYKYILRKYTNYDICKLQELAGYMDTVTSSGAPKTSQYKKLFRIG